MKARLITHEKIMLSWNVSEIPEKLASLYFNIHFEDLICLIRIYDVTDILFNGKNAHHYYEISVPYQNGFWYVKGLKPNRSYLADLGVYISENHFFPLVRSNSVQTQMEEGKGEMGENLAVGPVKENIPKWKDHVSTYSYYSLEDKND